MKLLVDTPVWSLALRRRVRSENASSTRELASLIEDGRVAMIGPVRQEVLSGIKEQSQFERLREHLRSFSDVLITSEDHEEAASFYNRCRGKGIQGSNTDFLICAIAARLEYPVFTTDKDFARFAKVLPIALHDANGKRVP
jgi:predicted nucleic acid-binding protein